MGDRNHLSAPIQRYLFDVSQKGLKVSVIPPGKVGLQGFLPVPVAGRGQG